MNTRTIEREYTRHERTLGRKESSIAWHLVLLRRFLGFLQQTGVRALGKVDHRTMVAYQQYVSSLTNRKGRPYCVNVQNMHLTVVRKLYCLMRKTGHVSVDPTIHLEYARPPRQLPKAVLSERQMKRLLRQAHGKTPLEIRNRAMLEILYSTGIRKNELVGLDISDICFDTRTMRVFGKGSKERMVPFGNIASHWLREYLRAARPKLNKPTSGEALFLNNWGTRMHGQTLKRAIEECANAARIGPHVTPHTFRHSCATHLLDRGADIRFIQELLGHAQLSTTARYTRVSISKLQKVHSRFHPRERLA